MNEGAYDIRGWLSLLVVVGGGYLLYNGDPDLRLSVSNLVTMVLSFHFGTSQGSRDKDAAISKAMTAQTDAAKTLADKVPAIVPAAAPTAVQPVEVVNRSPVDVSVVPPEKPS